MIYIRTHFAFTHLLGKSNRIMNRDEMNDVSLPAKRSRQQYTNSYKSDVLQWHFAQNVVSKRNTCRHFNIDHKQLRGWMKIKGKIENAAKDVEKRSQKRAKTPPKTWKVHHIDKPRIDWTR